MPRPRSREKAPAPAPAAASEVLDLEPGARIVAARAPFAEGDMVPALQEVQEAYGWLPRPALDRLAELTVTPVARFYGVATFYGQFYLAPHGKHTIRLCRGTACHGRSAAAIMAAVERHLGIGDGQTTADLLFSLETVACLGTCFLSPAMLIGNRYFGQLTSERAVQIIAAIRREE